MAAECDPFTRFFRSLLVAREDTGLASRALFVTHAAEAAVPHRRVRPARKSDRRWTIVNPQGS